MLSDCLLLKSRTLKKLLLPLCLNYQLMYTSCQYWGCRPLFERFPFSSGPSATIMQPLLTFSVSIFRPLGELVWLVFLSAAYWKSSSFLLKYFPFIKMCNVGIDNISHKAVWGFRFLKYSYLSKNPTKTPERHRIISQECLIFKFLTLTLN